jgi:hypothetical protein
LADLVEYWLNWWSNGTTGLDGTSGEMPGIPLPARFSRESDESALDMVSGGLSLPPDTPPEMRGLFQLLADVSAPAALGERTAEPAALSRVRRCDPAPGVSHAALQAGPVHVFLAACPSSRQANRQAVIAAVGLGGTAAAYATRPIRRGHPEFHVTTPQGKGRLE